MHHADTGAGPRRSQVLAFLARWRRRQLYRQVHRPVHAEGRRKSGGPQLRKLREGLGVPVAAGPALASQAAALPDDGLREHARRPRAGWALRVERRQAAVGPVVRAAAGHGVDANPAKDVGNTIHGLYPSLLDPNSPSLNYDTIVGDTAYVYWVQGRNKTAVGAPDMARDLWRQKVRITWG